MYRQGAFQKVRHSTMQQTGGCRPAAGCSSGVAARCTPAKHAAACGNSTCQLSCQWSAAHLSGADHLACPAAPVPQALDALELVPEEQQDAVLQLRGQLCYRLGRNEDCMDAYNQLTQLVKVGVVWVAGQGPADS